MSMRNWQWWKLYTRVKPLLTQARADNDIKKQAEEFEATKKELEKVLGQKKALEEQNAVLAQQKNDMAAQLSSGGDVVSDLEEKLEAIIIQRGEMTDQIKELEDQLTKSEGGSDELITKLNRMEDAFNAEKKAKQDVELALQKAEQEKQTKDNQIKTLHDEMARSDEGASKLSKDKKAVEETLKKTQADLAAEEDKVNHLNKLKQKLEQTIDEVIW